jgi:carbon storage regulator CsrA
VLVLGRSAKDGDNAILIGDDIRIVIVSHSNDKVRVAIDCPKHIHIIREELIARGHDRGRRPTAGDGL